MKIKKLEWKDVTLEQFYKISEFVGQRDDYTTCNIIDLLFGIDSANIPLSEFSEYKQALSFLQDEIKPGKKMKTTLELNGTRYVFDFNLTVVTTAQYIDFQNYCKTKPIKYEDMLSVFVFPEGHSYNDGYDIAKLKEDMLQCPISMVVTGTFFFTRQLELYTQIFPICFKEEVEKMKLPKEQEKKIISEIYKVDWHNLASFRTLAECVQNSTKAGQA